jgi:exosortase
VDAALRSARPGRWPADVGAALAVGGLFSLSPLTPSPFGERAWASLALGALAAAATLAGRRIGWWPGGHPLRWHHPDARPAPWTLAMAGMIAAAFLPTAAWLVMRWTQSVWQNAHGIFVPVAMVWLGRRALQAEPLERFAPSAWCAPLLAGALALLALGASRGSHAIAAFGLVAALPGLALLLGGREALARLWLPLSLAPFSLPVDYGSPVHEWLRRLGARASEAVLVALRVPVARYDEVLLLPHGSFEVGDACSGFATLYACIAFALVMAQLVPSRARRVWVLAAAVPVALVANVARILALIGAAAVEPGVLDSPLHKGTGVATFLVGFFALAALSGLLSPRRRDVR